MHACEWQQKSPFGSNYVALTDKRIWAKSFVYFDCRKLFAQIDPSFSDAASFFNTEIR